MKSNDLVHLSDVLELMLDAVCVVDREGNFVFVSAAFERIFGYAPSEVIGQPMDIMILPEDVEKTHQVVENLLEGELKPRFENRWVHKSGRVVHVLWSARWSEKHQYRIAVAHDITERKKMEARLERMARHDPLTDLPNRSLFLDRLQTGLSRARRESSILSLLFIDLDCFKEINDQYGHGIGDQLLQAVAKRLAGSIRDSDSAARQGGDEFLILLNNIAAFEDAYNVACKICRDIGKGYLIDGIELKITASIGIAHYPDHANDVLTLIQRADHAMYQAKNAGGNQISEFAL
ncbi:diguanylate cyclase domain-containing protein [Marinomonas pollencensis]|uniref:Diguanylate cyclase with PAS/PAC sensor n=1 Tax=Marinomonas pollencensis TaxID=491954 RepID=A0A3E0DSR7_9GAMM|nr:diguanylate cyclase [Marinomonas pollencensis]REG86599.1 diguanylate cyclase with PAS/PAC sensor [Marinomonas pollencensis]